MNCIPEYLPPEAHTTRIPRQSMSEMVYGTPPRRRSPVKGAIAIGIFIGLVGCASAPAPRAVDVETVGTLTASDTHVAQAPVHATTDFAPAAAVADTGDDVPVQGKTSLDVLRSEVAAGGGDVAVAAKTDGVTMGGAQ